MKIIIDTILNCIRKRIAGAILILFAIISFWFLVHLADTKTMSDHVYSRSIDFLMFCIGGGLAGLGIDAFTSVIKKIKGI